MWYFQGLYLFFLLDIQADLATTSSHIRGRKKYFIGTDKVTGNQAVEMCRRRSMKLASIRNEEKNNDVLRFLSQQDLVGGFYISGKKLSYGEAFSWLDGNPIKFFSWNEGEPNGYIETESCIDVFIKNGALTWDDQPCEYPGFYLCESAEEETSIDDEEDTCNSRKSSDKKYYLGTEKMTYFDAIEYCEKMFMQLATVRNAKENFSIYKLMLVRGTKTDYFWISANQRRGSNIWRWLDGKILKYFNWNEGEPNNDRPRENGMAIFKKDQDVRWDDAPCEHKYYPVCEKVDPSVEIYVNRKLLSSNQRKSYPSHFDYIQIFLDLPKNNALLRWDIVKK